MGADISKDSFIRRWPHWVRWILVLPAAVIGGALVAGLFGLLNIFNVDLKAGDIWFQEVQNFLLGGAFVFLGAATAPRSQFVIGLLLLIIVVAFSSLLALVSVAIGAGDRALWLVITDCVVVVVGGAAALIYIHNGQKGSI